MVATLFYGGVIYAPGQPEATALIVQGEQIAWVGDDQTAQQIAGEATQVFLDGGLITALPVDLRIGATSDSLTGLVSANRRDITITAPQAVAEPESIATQVAALGNDLAESLTILCDDDAAPLVHHLASLQAQGIRVGRIRLQLAPGAKFSPDLLEILPPMVNVIVDISDGAHQVPLLGFVSNGFVFGLMGDLPPWEAMRAALNHPTDPLSGRAAYQAYTRGAWRIVGKQDAGMVSIGQVAHLGVWQARSLSIQVPKISDNLGSWSTDARAKSGMLPDLGPDMELPTLITCMIAGELSK